LLKTIVILSLPVLLLLLAPVAYALPFGGSNKVATGTFSESVTVTGATVVGTGELVTDTVITRFSGDMVGIAVSSGSEMVYPNGSAVFEASGTFVGSIMGSPLGAFHETYSGTGMGANFQGHGEDRDGKGGLFGLTGVGSFQGMFTSATTATGTYTLLAHF
jgi:hypothetical protein